MHRLSIFGLLSWLLISNLMWSCSDDTKKPDFSLTIVHMNDRHSHWMGLPNGDYDPAVTGDGTEGGAARWAAMIDAIRSESGNFLLLDAGDFTMGTFFTAAEGSAADLNMLKRLHFDAATLGNHEFDWQPAGLVAMLQQAESPTIPLVSANIHFDTQDPADDALQALYGPEGQEGALIHPYIIREFDDGTRVGITGMLGIDAESTTFAEPVTFSPDMDSMAATAQAVVDELRDKHKVDLVLMLAHLGVVYDGDQPMGESIELARKVEGIDIILSGHAHTPTPELIRIACEQPGSQWTTAILEAGRYGEFFGKYQVQRQSEKVSITGELVPVTDDVIGLATVTQFVEDMVEDVEQHLLGLFPQVPDADAFLNGDLFQVLTTSDFDLPRHYFECNNLAYLVADAMRAATGTQIAAVSNDADVRDALTRSNSDELSLSDAFIVAPLGIGPDGILGYPLVSFYLTWAELRAVLEGTTADEGQIHNDYFVVPSGLKLVFDMSYSQFMRIQQISLYENIDESDAGTVVFDANDGGWKVNQTDLVSVTTSLYIASFLTGFSLMPRNAQGETVSDLTSLIVYQDDMELKEWYALARYLNSFAGGLDSRYNDDELDNPLGPSWRRCRDLDAHPL